MTRTGKLWLLEGKAKTATLAEIIMAGFDGQATHFPKEHVKGEKGELQSPVAFDFSLLELPTEGPDATYQNVYNLLRQLLNLTSSASPGSVLTPSEIQELRADLDSRKEDLGDRTTYCIVKLPTEKTERQAHLNVLEEAAKLVNPNEGAPRLVFVEKMASTVDDEEVGEVEVDEEFQIRSSFRQLLLSAYRE